MKLAGMSARLAALAVVVSFFPLPVAAQADDLARVRTALGEVPTARLMAVIDAGVRDGLPRDLLVDKAVEGVAKRMDPGVVVAAVDAYADELRVASAVIGTDAESASLEKAADALRVGVDRDLLASLSRDRSDDFSIMVVALVDLLDAGVERQLAEDMIRYAASQGLDGDQVLALPASVKRLVREGSTPAEAASSVSRRMRDGGGARPAPEARTLPGILPRSSRRPPPFAGALPGPGRPS